MELHSEDSTELASEEPSELTELILNPEITEAPLSGSLINEEAGHRILQEIDTQAPTDLGCDTYNMPSMPTSMLATLPLAEIELDFSNQDVTFGLDWPQNNTMDNVGQLDLDIQHEEANATDTWPLYSFDPDHELPLQPFVTMTQSENIETSNLDTFLSDIWLLQGSVGDQTLGDYIETEASSSGVPGQFEGSNDALNQFWRPSLDWPTGYNDPDQNISLGEILADSTHHSNDAVWSSDLLNILDASSQTNTNAAAQIPHGALAHQNGPKFDGNSAQSILSVSSGAPTQELHPQSEPSLAAPRAEMYLPVATETLLMGTLGPVRPVTLPPLRRGGKKGPLSAQERQNRKQARRRGVCIRCRRLKQKCFGGLPCEPCLQLSKATLWISPCAVANFFDIVKLQPYFLGSKSQQKTVENLDIATVVKAGLLVSALGGSGADGKIQAQTFPPHKTYALVNWAAAANILTTLLEKTTDNDAPMFDHLSQVADVQPEPSSWHEHPILVPVPSQYQEKGKDLDKYLLFCALPQFEFMSWKNPISHVPDEEATDVGCKTLHILTWITKRRLEQKLFQRLQGYLNKLNTLSPSQLSFTATLILRVITFGNQLAHLEFADEYAEQIPSAHLSQRHQVRQSLFCYLKIVIDKLPAWSDFWKEQTEHIVPITPEILRLSLSDLEIYDKRLLGMSSCFKQSLEWYENFGAIFEKAEIPPETDDMHLARIFSSLVDGSYVSSTIKALIQRTDHFHQTKIREPLESIENAIGQGISPSHLPIILHIKELLVQAEEEVEDLLKSLKDVQQRLEGFSRAETDITTEFDLIGSISAPSIPAEAVSLCSEVLNEILGSAEVGTD
ncbi:uncharacterized protein FTJAE_5031 [Fusarium tjaetaba]|uniref:Zn(2)-C6 fungal-type domain-containing protein n=1 Tax=Fusarium tjaetaba TaxID=1567544 RepID=A0A8H5VYB3_9HYPO|nr:uncharacterized protein FTJAE_5031 [Fusarium tjaetaba]KAF5638960.1 hypothetical protein FTJAE_5031 [Fusarium tjaetaba]